MLSFSDENLFYRKSKKLIVHADTSIQKNDLTSINRGKEIEKEVRKSLTEVMSPLMAETVTVNVYNMNPRVGFKDIGKRKNGPIGEQFLMNLSLQYT